jgi:hypothetical protein
MATHRKKKILMALFLLALNMMNFQKVSLAAVDWDEAVSLTPTFHSPEPSTTNNTSKYWSLNVSDRGENVDCRISAQQATTQTTNNLARDLDKIIIHIHGMHHSGTGYIRKTLLDALNHKFTPTSTAPPVACIHDSLLPYRHLYENETMMYLDHHKAEEEGQHLQTVYPSVHSRAQPLKEAKSYLEGHASKVAYLADFCLSKDDTENKRIGNILFEQWSRYWNVTSSTKFLLQKTPSLDVQFLESIKILPTLHVIIVRHPMTSNSWGAPPMSYGWAMAFHHVLELLNEGKVEWYAVVTYEALLEYRDVVVEELIEVVRSGIKRFGLASIEKQQLNTISNNNDSRFRRQLHLHDASGGVNNKKRANLWLDLPSNSYLIPKRKSAELWRECLKRSRCYQVLTHLTTDVLPFFGYVSIRKSNASLVKRINDGNATMSKTVPLTVDPSPVTVSKEFGRVLFSSEGDALQLLRQTYGNSEKNEAEGPDYIGHPPPTDLIVKIAELLEKFAIKHKSGT